MTEYLDDVLGRLIDYLDSSPLGESTYLMIMSDNGPQLLTDERRDQEVSRRGSGLQQQRTAFLW